MEIEKEENTLDVGGVTKEVFSIFFRTVFERHFSGRSQKTPILDHRFACSDLWTVIGRIMSHGFVLVSYFPAAFSHVALEAMFTGGWSRALALSSLQAHLPEHKWLEIAACLKEPTLLQDPVHKSKFLAAMDGYHLNMMPTKDTIQNTLEEVAITEFVLRPMILLTRIKTGMMTFDSLWNGITTPILEKFLLELVPSPSEVIELLKFEHTDEQDVRVIEEHVKGFLDSFISSLSSSQIRNFLIFCTSSEYTPEYINVTFNSLEGECRRPTTLTCTNTITVSRMYFNEIDFRTNMAHFIFSETSQVFDIVYNRYVSL